jgi:hypothetical protein
MTGANTFALDTTVYQPQHANLSALAGLATTVGNVRQTAANVFGIDTTVYQTQLNGTGLVRMAATTVSYDATVYATNNAQWTTTGTNLSSTLAGNVGIGTTAFRQKLDVEGTVYMKGNVGIGTSVPQVLLDVNGTIYSHGNVGIGTSAPRSALEVNGVIYGLYGFQMASPAINQTGSGLWNYGTAGEAITIDNTLYASGLTLWKAEGDASTHVPCVAFAMESASAGANFKVLKAGYFRDDSWTWTPGGLLYLSPTTAGLLTQTRPSSAGHQVQIVGYAISATVIYFNPDYTFVEI